MTTALKVVIDTSVFVSAYISKSETSATKRVLQEWRNGSFTLAVSPQIRTEIVINLYKKKIPEDFIEALIAEIEVKALNLRGDYHTNYMDNIDPKDNIILGAALEAHANYIVTGDIHHLIPIKYFHGTYIISPNQLLELLEEKKELIHKLLRLAKLIKS